MKAAVASAEPARDLQIQLSFAKTFHDAQIHEYTLDVVADFAGGKEPVRREYRVVSSAKDSMFEKLNTNVAEGKAKAARLLMERLMPDIEQYIAAM